MSVAPAPAAVATSRRPATMAAALLAAVLLLATGVVAISERERSVLDLLAAGESVSRIAG